jgi:hypothetical protein
MIKKNYQKESAWTVLECPACGKCRKVLSSEVITPKPCPYCNVVDKSEISQEHA